MTQGAKRNATTDRDTSRPRMLARLSGDLAGCAAALILGVFCVVGLAALLLYPVTLHRRRSGLTAAVGLEIFIIFAAGFTLWMGFGLAAM